jgi:integral membrane protein (TIGR01906 family)
MISIEVNSYNQSYFTKSYEKYNIESVTSKSSEELKIITIDLIKYLKGLGGNELLEPHFNEREILHMEDVQYLFDLARMVKYISTIISILILLYFLRKKEIFTLGKTLFYGIFANYILIALLGVLILFDFNKYFTYFHLIFFSNELWILDPRTDLMIQMLPEQFFFGMARNIGLTFFLSLAIIQLIGFIIIRRYKKNRIEINL